VGKSTLLIPRLYSFFCPRPGISAQSEENSFNHSLGGYRANIVSPVTPDLSGDGGEMSWASVHYPLFPSSPT
jgi:hypothetical protein